MHVLFRSVTLTIDNGHVINNNRKSTKDIIVLYKTVKILSTWLDCFKHQQKKKFTTMIEKSSTLNLFDQMMNTLVRRNGSRNSTKIHSMTTFIIVLVLGIIQRKYFFTRHLLSRVLCKWLFHIFSDDFIGCPIDLFRHSVCDKSSFYSTHGLFRQLLFLSSSAIPRFRRWSLYFHKYE